MKTQAYASSNPEVEQSLRDEIGRLDAEIKSLEGYKSSTPEGRRAKAQIVKIKEQIEFLRAQMPATLFCEEGALASLEEELVKAEAKWEAAKAEWLASAASDLGYAIRWAASIVGAQADHETMVRLGGCWKRYSAEEGRSLASFRKAVDATLEWRRREMMSALTGGQSSSAFHNAVEHERGCQFARQAEYGENYVFAMLRWYEGDAVKMEHTK